MVLAKNSSRTLTSVVSLHLSENRLPAKTSLSRDGCHRRGTHRWCFDGDRRHRELKLQRSRSGSLATKPFGVVLVRPSRGICQKR